MIDVIKPYNYNANMIGKVDNYKINFIEDSDTTLSINLSNFNINSNTTYADIVNASAMISELSTATYSETLITQTTSADNMVNIGDFLNPPDESYNLVASQTTVQNVRYKKFAEMTQEYYAQTGGMDYWYSGLMGKGVGGYPAYIVTQYNYSGNKAIRITPNLSSGNIYCVGYEVTGVNWNTRYVDCIFKFLVNNPQPLDVEIKFVPLFYLGGNLVPVTLNLKLV